MRQVLAVLIAVSALGALASAASGAVRPLTSARLVVVVSGLPSGEHPAAILRGPEISVAVRADRLVLPHARPGTYVVELRRVRISRAWRSVAAGAVALPKSARVRVTARPGRTAILTARYGTVVNPRVHRLPSGLSAVHGNPASPAVLVYPGGAAVPAVGSIVLAAPSAVLPDGLIARVTAVSHQGSSRLVSITNVPVSEAVPEFTFTGAIDLHPAADRSSALARKADTSCGGYLSLFDVGASLDQFQIRQASAGLWPPQMSLTLAVRTSEHLGNRAFAVSVQCAHDLGQIGAPWRGAIPTPVGPLPVYASLPITLSGSVSGSGPGFRLNHASTHVITLDLGHRNNFGFQEEGANTWQSGTSGGETADIALQASLEFGVGDPNVGNLHLDVGFGPDLTIRPSSGCDLELDLGSVSAGVKIGWFGASTPSWTPFHQHLWHGCAPAPGSGGGVGGSGGGNGGSGGSGGSGTSGGSQGYGLTSCVSGALCRVVWEPFQNPWPSQPQPWYVYSDTSGHWSGPTPLLPQDPPPALRAVSCTPSGFCMVIANRGDDFVTTGGSWQAGPASGVGAFDVSCASASFCVVVGAGTSGDVTIYDGTSWSTPVDIDRGALYSVSCTSPTFCVAVGTDGNAVTYDGSTWSTPQPIDPTAPGVTTVTGVSCASTSLCVAVGSDGNAEVYNGTSWSSPRQVDPQPGLTEISCAPGTSFCAGVDNDGRAYTYRSGVWTAPVTIDYAVNLHSVSCTSSTSCLAVDADGAALAYNGSSWSAPYPFAN